MPTLIKLMKDPSVCVRDTTAWTVGRICELLPEAAINEVYLAPLLQCLIEGLEAEPRVATNVCWVTSQSFTASFLNQPGPRRPTLLCMKMDLVKLWVSHTHPPGLCPFRPSRLWLKRRTRLPMLPRTWMNPAPTVCPHPLRSLSISFWRPQTGEHVCCVWNL